MNEYIEQALALPLKTKLGILGGLVIIILGGYWFLFFSDVSEELEKTKQAIDGPNGLRYQIAQQKGIAENLDEFREEVRVLDIELNKALSELPDTKEIGDLLAKVSTVGRDSGLEVRVFKPREEQKKDYYAEVPVEMEVFGSYHQVASFFDEVGHLERIVNLGEFNMHDPEVNDEAVYLKTSVVATTFRFLEENERPKADEETSGKRRGRGGNKKSNKK